MAFASSSRAPTRHISGSGSSIASGWLEALITLFDAGASLLGSLWLVSTTATILRLCQILSPSFGRSSRRVIVLIISLSLMSRYGSRMPTWKCVELEDDNEMSRHLRSLACVSVLAAGIAASAAVDAHAQKSSHCDGYARDYATRNSRGSDVGERPAMPLEVA
jgi:hypothetical protein